MKLVPAKTAGVLAAVPPPRTWYDDIPRSTAFHKLGGWATIAGAVLGFGIWANTALITGAVVATGIFVTTGQNKIVQHLEGGVIKEILVREGDIVEPGQTLVVLDDTTPRAELRRLALRNALDTAKIARYTAEIQGDREVDFPTDLAPKAARLDIRDIDEIIETQKLAFEARRKNLDTQIAALTDSINALQKRIDAGGLQENAVRQQVHLIREELASKSTLLPGGLIKKSELLALQRTEAGLMGEIGRLGGDMGDAKARIARTREEIAGVRAAAIKDAVEQLHQVGAELADVRERMRAAEGVLSRIEIKAPVRGTVVKLRYHTRGGVIEPGKPVLEIVPTPDDLVVEARVRSRDIDHVEIGQTAAIRLTALDQRVTPIAHGHVVYVSADAVPDDAKPGQTPDTYVTRVRLDHRALAPEDPNFKPKPGMPAEVYIQTGSRTFFEYLIKPVTDSMQRAFREH
ncbi:MAG TPA: HlyD family type I secretion periplasmic adaptor subunit [Pseudolabrys sp.]|nr:HlyD family type I secretion periplasmic adaptor subunit [Pseudolabrys sp.]